MRLSMPLVYLLTSIAVHAQTTVVPLTGKEGQRLNEQTLFVKQAPQKSTGQVRNKVVAFPGDNVIPHLADGGSWSSAVTLTNLDTRTVRVNVLFFRDDGSDMVLPVAGQGSVRGMRVTLPPANTITFSTMGVSAATSTGWAYIQKEDGSEAVSGMCVFRQRTSGRPDFEAVVPIVNEFDTRAVLLYDNTNSFVTAAAFANPSSARTTIMFTVRAEDGTVLERKSLTLEPYAHTAGTISGSFASTVGRRGSIELTTSSSFGIGVVGLRFNPSGSFTSFHVLSNINWLL